MYNNDKCNIIDRQIYPSDLFIITIYYYNIIMQLYNTILHRHTRYRTVNHRREIFLKYVDDNKI